MPFCSQPGRGEEYVNELRHGVAHVDEGIAKIRAMGVWRDDVDWQTCWSDPEYPTFLLTSEETTRPNAVAGFKAMNSTGEKFVFTGPTVDPSLVTMSAANDTLIRQVESIKQRGGKVAFFSFGTTFPITNAVLKDMYKYMTQLDGVTFVIAHVTQNELPDVPDDTIVKPPNVITMRRVPQIPLLKLVDAFITHGGQNSVMEALVQNVPLVVVPWQVDQPKNAWHVQSYGAGRAVPTPLVVRLQAQEFFATKHGMSEERFDAELNMWIREAFKHDDGDWYATVEDEIKEKGDFYVYKTTYLVYAITNMYQTYEEIPPEMVLFNDAPNLCKHIFAGLQEILQNEEAYSAKAAKLGKSLMETRKAVGVDGIVARVNGFV
jgi:hypothetical protein